MRRRTLTVVSAALLALALLGGSALAAPPIDAGPHETDSELMAHPHHVRTGNGGCVDLGAPDFQMDVRGLHHGANMSSDVQPPDEEGEPPQLGERFDPTRGPWHGTCEEPW